MERSLNVPGTSRLSCWPTRTGRSCISASGSATSSAHRRCSRRARRRRWDRSSVGAWEPPRDDLVQQAGYVGAGTAEFLVPFDDPDAFAFLEVNARLQVEHPVTEVVTGLDLVERQLRIAAGEPLAFAQEDVSLTGHSVEARVCAEDPGVGFLPATGRVVGYREPRGPGVRVDSGIRLGFTR